MAWSVTLQRARANSHHPTGLNRACVGMCVQGHALAALRAHAGVGPISDQLPQTTAASSEPEPEPELEPGPETEPELSVRCRACTRWVHTLGVKGLVH